MVWSRALLAPVALCASVEAAQAETSRELTADFLLEQCLDEKPYCYGQFFATAYILNKQCSNGEGGFAADLGNVSPHRLMSQFIANMADQKFRKLFADENATFAIIATASAEWPCDR